MNTVIDAHNVRKIYNPDTVPVVAISNVHLHIESGEFTALVGPSGSGKTTLLNLIGGLDKPDEGSIVVNGVNITELAANKLIDFRLHNIGFVFQSFNLIPVLSAKENVELILQLQGADKAKIEKASNGFIQADRPGRQDEHQASPTFRRAATTRGCSEGPCGKAAVYTGG